MQLYISIFKKQLPTENRTKNVKTVAMLTDKYILLCEKCPSIFPHSD